LNSAGTSLLYSTYLSGSVDEYVFSLALNASGNAYVSGYTQSKDFPVTTGAFQMTNTSSNSAFITELNPAGSGLVYSTFLGGSVADYAYAIALDSSGNAYATGRAESSDFPVTTGAFQATNKAPQAGNAFITKFNLGSSLSLAATPTFSPAAGTYSSTQSVVISDATPNATIYYTTDDTTPTTSSPQYGGSIAITDTTTIQAMAVASGYSESAVASATYTINTTVATPVIAPTSGKYPSGQLVTIVDSTSGTTIYYTTDGSTPTTSSNKYSAPFAVRTSETIEAIAFLPDTKCRCILPVYSQSAPASATYTISSTASTASTPTFSPAAGTYATTQSVTIADATSGATIYYTTNGTTPTTSSTKCAGAISVSATKTIEAIAIATGYTNSAVATAKYTITPTAATPTFSPVAGTYTSPQSVTISDTTAGATIYYTTNGTTPASASTKYAIPIKVSATETIKAIAVATGYTNSVVATAKYTITPTAATPTFSPVAGTYTSPQSVTISDATAGATIYYTTNGTAPTASSTKYTGAIKVSATETIEAIAVATGTSQSAVATGTYTVATTPTVITKAATVLSASGATLNGTVTANNASTQYWFSWGTSKTSLIGNTTKTGPLTGTTSAAVTAKLTGLKTKTTYYFQAVASNAAGTTPGAVLYDELVSGNPGEVLAGNEGACGGRKKSPSPRWPRESWGWLFRGSESDARDQARRLDLGGLDFDEAVLDRLVDGQPHARLGDGWRTCFLDLSRPDSAAEGPRLFCLFRVGAYLLRLPLLVLPPAQIKRAPSDLTVVPPTMTYRGPGLLPFRATARKVFSN
jgi:hypothetical protein